MLLQCVAVCCSVLQCDAVWCSVLTRTSSVCAAPPIIDGNTLQRTATHCNTLQHTATHCNTLQHTATAHCNAKLRLQQSTQQLQGQIDCNSTATHCNSTATHSYTHRLGIAATRCKNKNAGNKTAQIDLESLQHTATHCNALQHCNAL